MLCVVRINPYLWETHFSSVCFQTGISSHLSFYAFIYLHQKSEAEGPATGFLSVTSSNASDCDGNGSHCGGPVDCMWLCYLASSCEESKKWKRWAKTWALVLRLHSETIKFSLACKKPRASFQVQLKCLCESLLSTQMASHHPCISVAILSHGRREVQTAHTQFMFNYT